MTDAITALREQVEAGDHRVGMWDAVRSPLHPHAPEYARQAFLGSLDAAKALHEALLPGWKWDVNTAGASVFMMAHPHDGNAHGHRDDTNPARAWLIAILRALEAQGGQT